jgi:tripartite-type tricarboxylate transporter receptor subunit TctC
MERNRLLSTFVPALAAVALVLPGAAAKAAEADYFKGKTVSYIVATGAGGGFDFYGRLVAKHMQDNLPGTTFVVRNMPGAGHRIGTNHIYKSKPNGLTMGTFSSTMLMTQIIGSKGVRFDLAKMNFLGKASISQQSVLVNAKLPYRSIAEVVNSGKSLKMASGGPGSGRWFMAKIAESSLKTKFRMIPGYTGPDAHLAMMRGEIDVMMGSVESNAPIAESKPKRAFHLAIFATKRLAKYPNVPTAFELIKDPDQKQLAQLITTVGEVWRITAVPPGLPAGRLALLRAVYKKSLQDPKLRFRAALNLSPKVTKLLKEATTVRTKITYLKHSGKVTKTKRGGRRIWIMYKGKEVKAKISGSRTKVTLNGKPDRRKTVKPGRTCTFVYIRPGSEAKQLNCKN